MTCERVAGIQVLFYRGGIVPAVRRREVLVAIGGSLATTGCVGLLGGGSDETETLTPAPVPTTGGDVSRPSERTRCPELPAEAEAYVCSSRAESGNGLRLIPEASTYDAGTGGFEFTLSNQLSLPFRTGRDRWTLGHRTAEGWSVLARGEGTGLRAVEPGGSVVWVLGGGDADATQLDVDVGGGQHALAVTGAVPRGVLTAVVSSFRIEPSIA